MKAIILAAGVGSRITDNIGPVPKSTLKINGKAIIRNTTEMLINRGIDVAICTGYRYQMIQQVLEGLPVNFYNNPFYAMMNNIGTLWFAKDFLCDDDCIIISADVVFEDTLLERIIIAEGDLLMVTDSSRTTDGDYFFSLDADGRIIEYGPELSIEKRSCEYVGLSKISRNASKAFNKQLINMVEDGDYKIYFENVFFSFINNEKYQLKTIDVSGCAWREIDKIEDYKKALTQFS